MRLRYRIDPQPPAWAEDAVYPTCKVSPAGQRTWRHDAIDFWVFAGDATDVATRVCPFGGPGTILHRDGTRWVICALGADRTSGAWEWVLDVAPCADPDAPRLYHRRMGMGTDALARGQAVARALGLAPDCPACSGRGGDCAACDGTGWRVREQDGQR